jgi:hypothetical protein
MGAWACPEMLKVCRSVLSSWGVSRQLKQQRVLEALRSSRRLTVADASTELAEVRDVAAKAALS